MIREIAYQSREEWLEMRRGYVGGSEAGVVMGLNPYSSPYRLWAEKTGRLPEFTGNLTTRVGAYLEEFVAGLFTEETGKKVRRKNRMLVNDLYPFACADIDRLVVGEKALLEIKTTNSFPVMKKVRGGEYPEQWYCQMTHYLAVTGLERAYLGVLVNCRDFFPFTLERDQGEIDALMEAERDFWKLVQEDRPPAADGSPSTSGALQAVYGECQEGQVSLFGREALFQEYKMLLEQQKAKMARIRQIKQTLMLDLGECEEGACGRFRVSWKQQKRAFVSREKLLDVYPKLDLSKVMRVSKYRRFQIQEERDAVN